MNTETKQVWYTPGPWFVACGSVWTTPYGSDDGGASIARMDRDEQQTTPTERDANARLIAAAPDLLEVCRLLDGHWAAGNFSRDPAMWRVLRAAIAKATGA